MTDPTSPADPGDMADLLARSRQGDRCAEAELVDCLYRRLREIARVHMAKERADHTLQPTALVNEAYASVRTEIRNARDRAHIMALMSRAMRQVLIDHARKKRAVKRTPSADLDSSRFASAFDDQALDVSVALDELAAIDARACQVAEYRYYHGLTLREVASTLEMHPSAARRDWRAARAFLASRLPEYER